MGMQERADAEVESIEEQFENGEITEQEMRIAIRGIADDLRESEGYNRE